MKKLIISMLLVASCFGVANAQLMVDETGKTGVGIETNDTLYSLLAVNRPGINTATSYIYSENLYGLYIYRDRAVKSGNYYGIMANNSASSTNYNYGIYGSALGYSGSGATIGVYGRAGNAGSGYNFGVCARLNLSNKGAALLATTEASSRYDLVDVGGVYAGYFYGDTRVTGTMTAGAFVTSSDYRLKENVRSLSSTDGCLDKLMDMNVVEFNNKQRQFETVKSPNSTSVDGIEEVLMDTCNISSFGHVNKEDSIAYWHKENSPIIKNKHYGLIAQELQRIYPDLVVESQDGYLAVNYLEIIPLLIRSVQELKAELDESKSGNAPIQKAQARTTDATDLDAVVTTLYQNTPNPFTESTVIRCDVAENVVKADLYIYNMNGEQIAEYSVTERGETSVTIDGGSLNAGMYLYALITDGQVIDTKRMILTK